jgi:hypothetical protein
VPAAFFLLKIKNYIMKSKLFILLLLSLLGRGTGEGLFAQTKSNGITITNFNVAADDAASTVTFDIQWPNTTVTVDWSDIVWVFADYNDKGTMTRLPLTGATLTDLSWPEATYTYTPDNKNGVWIRGNAKAEDNLTGSFNARVQLYSDTPFAAGACAYAINYPPVGSYTAANQITLHGTPPFKLTLLNGGEPETVPRNNDHN